MKKYLLVISMLILTNCSIAPVTRYSSSIGRDDTGVGVDLSYGRRLETGISSDGSIDSSDVNDIFYPIVGFNLHHKMGNLLVNGKLYGFIFSAFGAYLGADYYFKGGQSSPFIGLDLAFSGSSGKSLGSTYSYNGFSSIGVLGYSFVKGKNFSFSPMLRGGVSIVDVEGNSHTMPEMGVGINAFWKFRVAQVSPEIFINGTKLPSGDFKLGFYPGIFMGFNF